MKKYLGLILILFVFNLSNKAIAGEVEEKPINSSFVGDISNSMVNESWGHEDLQKKTDDAFVGTDPVGNNYFAGDGFDREVNEQTDAPFAEENSKTPTDGVFLGEDVKKQTDVSSAGDSYGK